MAGSSVLEVRDLTVHHGQLRAVTDVSLSVGAGEVYAIIGANGAGKSTLLRTIAGSAPARRAGGPAGRKGHHRTSARTGASGWASRSCPRAAGCFRR